MVTLTKKHTKRSAISRSLLILSALMMCGLINLSHAENTSTAADIVAQVVTAYGGKNLLNLKSIQIKDEIIQTYPGQGYSPEFDDYWNVKLIVDYDLSNNRGNSERWADQYGRVFHERNTHTDGNRITTNYMTNTISEGEATDYYRDMGPDIRVSDTMLAYELARLQSTATYNGIIDYRGQAHHQLSYELPSSPTLNLYVNVETGFISRMHRYVEAYETHVNYLFANHASQKNVAFAEDVRIYFNNDFSSLVRSREIELNKVKPSAFKVDISLAKEPAAIDMSEMSSTALSDNVHHVGVGDYNVFIDAGDHIIGVGGSEGLKGRFDHYQQQQQNKKPLRYQIITHHHTDHMAGITEAYELGAILVMPEEIKRNVTDLLPQLEENRTMMFNKPVTLGPVQLYRFGTSHAAVNTLTYIPEAKAVFQADHHAGFQTGYTEPAGRPTYQMVTAVSKLNLDIDKLLSAHSKKVEQWSDLLNVSNNYNADPCPSKRAICK